jgi:ArsR family transcriptional regulator
METGAHLFALGALLPQRSIAVDAGTGDGRLLDVLAPAYEQVIAIDRSEVQLARARSRVAARGFSNVTVLAGEIDSPPLRRALTRSGGREARWGADAVFASRVLHHSPQPARAVAQLASLCAEGGHLVVIDYARHDDERMRDQADAWLGFDPAELRRFARAAGLEEPRVTNIAPNLRGDGPDHHLPWQVLIATKPVTHETRGSRTSNEKGRSDG